MSEVELVRTNCRFCGYLCGLIATIQDGRVIEVEPNPGRFPYDAGIQRGCRRWSVNLEFLDHPGRMNYPQKRIGERGSGQWERVSWDEALDDIAGRLQQLKERFGAETLATSIGGPHASYWPLHRFMNLFGSPNNIGIGQICWNPGIWINTLTFGWPLENELDPESTACAILWGVNPAESDNSLFWRLIQRFRRMGKPIIVIDPRKTRTALQAEIWLSVRPGTDPFLALGLLNVIVSKKLYHAGFVDAWCTGFNQLMEHVSHYSPEVVEAITGIQREKIIAAAHLFAENSPATIVSGRGIDQIGSNTIATHLAISILQAITGNVDVAGGSHLAEMPDFVPEIDLELSDRLAEPQRKKQLNEGKLGLQSYLGYQTIRQQTELHSRRLPMRYLTSAHPNLVWQAMITGKPYPVRALIVMGSNPMLTQADVKRVYHALNNLDLLVVLEHFNTPTAMLADYILPSAGGLERPLFQTHAGTANIAYGGEKAVDPYYERRPDFYFWKELGIRMGQADDWPWETFEDSLNFILAPAGLTWKAFCETGFYCLPSPYQKHEMTNPQNGKKQGFSTRSGKIEMYSKILQDFGYDPLPTPKPPSSVSDEYPLLLISGGRRQPFNGSALRQFDSLRSVQPHPFAEMSASTALKCGVEDGSEIIVETDRGSAQFRLKIMQIHEDVVSVDYGWWFPEQPVCKPELGGVWISNANVLTNADIESSDRLIGTWTYNGIPCRVHSLPSPLEINDER